MKRESEECRWGEHDQCEGCRACTCHPRRKYPPRTADYAMTHASPNDSEDVT